MSSTCSHMPRTHTRIGQQSISLQVKRCAAPHSTAQHSTAQHSTAQRSTAQHSTAQHSTAQHSTAQRSTAQKSATQHSTAQHSTAQHSTAQKSATQHSTAQHSTAQHSTAQHSTAQHSTAQHSTAQTLRSSTLSRFKIMEYVRRNWLSSLVALPVIILRTSPSSGTCDQPHAVTTFFLLPNKTVCHHHTAFNSLLQSITAEYHCTVSLQ